MRAGITTLVVVVAVGGLPAASAQDVSSDSYATIVERYRSDPARAIEQATALSSAAVAASPTRPIAEASDATSGHLQAAMLMHLEAALVLAKRRDGRVGAHIRAAQDVGRGLARDPDQAWFVHRWYRIVTQFFNRPASFDLVRRRGLPWNEEIASFETGLRLERAAMQPPQLFPGLDVRTYDTPELRRALSYFEPAASAGVLVAALHAARLQMLRGDDTQARRNFERAATAQVPSTRYLAHLFLGSMDERAGDVASAERHYVAASSVFRYAQSGRVALGSLLARSGRGKEAVAVVGRTPPANRERLSFDPWWLYTPPNPFEPGDTLIGMYAEVQK
jgi:hypothetical protein